MDTVTPFLNQWGEDLTYYPKSGGSRSIRGIVTRKLIAGLPGVPGGNSTFAEIDVANSAASGISSTEIDTGGDKIGYPLRIGEPPQPRRIGRILSQDADMIRVEVA